MSHFIFGIILICIGSSFLLHALFGIDLPILRIGIGLLVVIWGMHIMTNRSWFNRTYSTHINQFQMKSIRQGCHRQEHATIFSEQTVDLSHITPETSVSCIKNNTVFGQTTININHETPTIIICNAIFGSIYMPKKSEFTQPKNPEDAVLILYVTSVFGNVHIKSI